MTFIKRFILVLLDKRINPRGRHSFLKSLDRRKKLKLLDVGCGNESALAVKADCPNALYYGLDIGDYNQSTESKEHMDKYIVTSPELFDQKIRGMSNRFDAIISSHNIEHCYYPQKVIEAMTIALKKGGRLYMAFPSEASVNFPSRGGTLNFYDDETHVWLPEFDKIVSQLKENGMKINYANRRYRPLILRFVGWIVEANSRTLNRVIDGTWAYYGFEAIIWATKE